MYNSVLERDLGANISPPLFWQIAESLPRHKLQKRTYAEVLRARYGTKPSSDYVRGVAECAELWGCTAARVSAMVWDALRKMSQHIAEYSLPPGISPLWVTEQRHGGPLSTLTCGGWGLRLYNSGKCYSLSFFHNSFGYSVSLNFSGVDAATDEDVAKMQAELALRKFVNDLAAEVNTALGGEETDG